MEVWKTPLAYLQASVTIANPNSGVGVSHNLEDDSCASVAWVNKLLRVPVRH